MKTAHLKLCPLANEILKDGQAASESFFSVIFKDFNEEEIHWIKHISSKILDNLKSQSNEK